MRGLHHRTRRLIVAAFAGWAASAGAHAEEFDFHVLSLSWSPSYCAAEGEEANRQQCGGARPYAFVVHGLWPQFERGYPEYCPIQRDRVPDDLVARYLDIMPSAGLIGHQWRKHGSCSGLDQEGYLALVRQAREKISVPPAFTRIDDYRTVDPDAVEAAFIAANPEIGAGGIAVTCDQRYLREVRICMTKSLEFRACEEVDRRACARDSVVLPPVRGR